MCLIVFAWQAHPDYPLVVAANRDEYLARPAAPAHWWVDAPELLEKLIEETRAMFSVRREELQEVTGDLEALWKKVEQIIAQGGSTAPEDVRSVAALIYLQNPFDERFDGLAGHGLTDDVKVIREVTGRE